MIGVSILSPELDGKPVRDLARTAAGVRRIDALSGTDTANSACTRRRACDPCSQPLCRDRTGNRGGKGFRRRRAERAGSALLLGNRRVIFERAAALGLPAATTNVSPASPSSWSG